MKPSVFIGSSSENEVIAEAIERRLADIAMPRTWRSAFPPSQFYLESLMQAFAQTDFGVFVFAPDDTLRRRGRTMSTVRDNVLFEVGLSMGLLGRERTFIIAPRDTRMAIASDLHGLHLGAYDEPDPPATTHDVTRFCREIAGLIAQRGPRPPAPPTLSRLTAAVAAAGDSDLLLYTFCGQDGRPIELTDEADLSNRAVVFRLWSDCASAENRMHASLAVADGRHVIRLQFANRPGSMPGDVTIRPSGLKAARVPQGRRHLCFDVRATGDAGPRQDVRQASAPYAIAVRVIDAQATQWFYGDRDMRRLFPVPVDSAWTTVAVSLDDAWVRFDSDGNHCYAATTPDFSVIPAFVVEVGAYSAQRPAAGEGQLEISRIRFV